MWSSTTHPELEPTPASFNFDTFHASSNQFREKFDFIQLSLGAESSAQVTLNQLLGISDLNSEQLQTHLRKCEASRVEASSNVSGECIKVLQLIFLTKEDYIYNGRLYTPPVTSRSCEWLSKRYPIPAVFLGHLARGVIGGTGHIGNALFRNYDSRGRMTQLDGFYSRTDVWFNHDLHTGFSTYIIVNYRNFDKTIQDKILRFTNKENRRKLLKPLFIDVILADGIAWSLAEDIDRDRNEIIRFEKSMNKMDNVSIDTSKAISDLHGLSQSWYITSGDLGSLEERLHHLLKIHSTYYSAWKLFCQGRHLNSQEESACEIEDSVEFLISRTRTWMRWVENYNERTKIQINLGFNLSTQADNRINLEIARLTSNIAVDTQKDSSSMITMAAVTMFFLPGTFVSAIFSMVFFNIDVNPNGEDRFSVSNKFWYFAVVTVPLTLAVFVVWIAWRRWRISRNDILTGKTPFP